MRRKDREVTDIAKIREILSACRCCRLGFNDEGRVYIVPLNFGWKESEGRLTLYFHGAKEGRKIDLIKKTGYAAFETDTECKVVPADIACNYTAMYQSIIGEGRIEIIEDKEEKCAALDMIMLHNTGKSHWEYPHKMLEATCVYKLEAESFSCKVHE